MHAAGSLKILCGLFSFQVTVYIQNVTFRAHEVNHERSVRNHISIWEFTDLGDYLFELITWDPWEGQNAEVFRGATDGVSLVIPMI